MNKPVPHALLWSKTLEIWSLRLKSKSRLRTPEIIVSTNNSILVISAKTEINQCEGLEIVIIPFKQLTLGFKVTLVAAVQNSNEHDINFQIVSYK